MSTADIVFLFIAGGALTSFVVTTMWADWWSSRGPERPPEQRPTPTRTPEQRPAATKPTQKLR